MLRSALQLDAKKRMVKERRKQMKNWVEQERAPTTDDNDTVDAGEIERPQKRLKRMRLMKQ